MSKTQIVRQSSFIAGQVDPIQYNRTEFSSYLAAAQKLQNCIIDTTGLLHKRKGTILFKKLREKFDKLISMFASDDKFYIIAVRDFSITIFSLDGNYEQRLVTDYANPFNLDYTYIDQSLLLFYGGTKANGGMPPKRLKLIDGKFILEDVKFEPLPSRDFGDVSYNDATITVNNDKITVCLTDITKGNFNKDWIGGSIIVIGPDIENPIGEGIITDISQNDKCTEFTIKTIQTIPPVINSLDIFIRKPMMGDVTGWPKGGIYYANRLWLFGFEKSRDWIIASNVNKPLVYRFSAKESDSISFQVPQTDRKEHVTWLHAGRKLEVYTDRSVYTSLTTDVISQAKFQLAKRNSFGTSNVFKPISYQNDSYYVSGNGNSILKFDHDQITANERSINVTKASSKLVKNPSDRALITGSSISQDNIIYYLNEDGQLCAFQFSYETGLAAVTPFEMYGKILSVVEVNNELFILRYLPRNDLYFLEMLNSNLPVYLDLVSSKTIKPNNIVDELKEYEGYPVRAVVVNEHEQVEDLGEYSIVDGKIKIINYDFKNKSSVIIGYPYNVEVVPMFFYLGPNNSTVTKTVSQITVEYYDSLDFYIENELVKFQSYNEIQNNKGLLYKSGWKEINLLDGHNRYSTFRIHQRSPFNLCITSITYKITGAYV